MDIQGDACNCSIPPCTCEANTSINITDITSEDFEGKNDYSIQISGYFEDEWVIIVLTLFILKVYVVLSDLLTPIYELAKKIKINMIDD